MAEQAPDNNSTPVRVASYSNTTWQGSWRQRARAIWGTGFFGLLWGAGVGVAAGAAIFAFGAAVSVAVIPALALAGAAAGGGIGMAIADSVGTTAGAVSAGMAEWESRFKQMMVEAKLFDKSMVTEEPVSAALNRTEMVDTPEEVNLRGRMFTKAVNWPGLITFALMGAALGLIFAQAVPASMLAAAGIKAGAAGASILAGVIGAGFGAVFGVNCPVFTNKMNNSFGKIFSGEAFGKKLEPVITPAPKLEPVAGLAPPTKREVLVAAHEEQRTHPARSFQARLALEQATPSSPTIH